MHARLTHIRLLVSDFTACHRFYRDAMGFRPRFGDEKGVYEEFDAGHITLALFGRSYMAKVVGTAAKAAHADARDSIVMTFAVDSVDAVYEALRVRAVEFVTTPHDQGTWSLRVAHLRDPDGNLIEINAPLRPGPAP
jgi:lactoylglutathione lyase